MRGELINSAGGLNDEVRRLTSARGRYIVLCTGHDLTARQRNDARSNIVKVLAEVGVSGYEGLVDVLGAGQIAEYAERYPGTAALLARDQILDGLTFDEWQQDSQLGNEFKGSPDQIRLIEEIRSEVLGGAKHIRVLGEPGIGKTRIVLEALKEERIAPTVLYFPHGSQFGRSILFRQLLKGRHDKPLVLVIDELPDSEMADVWTHLKPRCGFLKIVSLDHGKDESYDADISKHEVPKLADDSIKKILADRIGNSRELDRWVAICEGSPRVALAVAENIRANPDDLLKPPATVQLWDRFLHGYGRREDGSSRQIDCVAKHLALFSRFGYEDPVGSEAVYIAALIQQADPSIGWARFQEIVSDLRSRKVLQGSKTLFFVPKALHIYLWSRFWETYGRGFDFTRTFDEMPHSLHTWFLSMFKYAGGPATYAVINDILRLDGIFSDRTVLASNKGSRFLSMLAEANPGAVLRLLEGTIGSWSDQELLEFKHDRQYIVWTLEKIAVWSGLIGRAAHLLARLSTNENAENSNNSTGILIGLFRIGPEAAATEASPQIRLPILIKLLRSSLDNERRLGLKGMLAALDSDSSSFRIIGPEYQGMKRSASLWIPQTHEEWRQAKQLYFQAMVRETSDWPPAIRIDLSEALLQAAQEQIKVPECTELGFEVLESLASDSALPSSKLNGFFRNWKEYQDPESYPEISKRIKKLERQYCTRDLASRFQRYVIDMNYGEWDEAFREERKKPKTHAKALVRALACRIAKSPELFSQIRPLLSVSTDGEVIWEFGRQLGAVDNQAALSRPLVERTLETKNPICLHGYLSALLARDSESYREVIDGLLSSENTAWLGVSLTLRSEYNPRFFDLSLDAFAKKWVNSVDFQTLRYGRSIEKIPAPKVAELFRLLSTDVDVNALFLLNELLHSIPFNESSPFDSSFIFGVVSRSIPDEEHRGGMVGHYWKEATVKLLHWDPSRALPLLDKLLVAMGTQYRLSYDSHIVPLANGIVRLDPPGAWEIIVRHIEQALPKWRTDILQWLRGGLSGNEDQTPHGAITDVPIELISNWIDVDPEPRSILIARAAPRTLDDDGGGALTRFLLEKYGRFEDVKSGISAIFGSGGWSGPSSHYYKRRRDKLRKWLSAGYASEVAQWLEVEIETLDRMIEGEETNEERTYFE